VVGYLDAEALQLRLVVTATATALRQLLRQFLDVAAHAFQIDQRLVGLLLGVVRHLGALGVLGAELGREALHLGQGGVEIALQLLQRRRIAAAVAILSPELARLRVHERGRRGHQGRGCDHLGHVAYLVRRATA
jgi:hypothetical protein